MTSPVRAPRPTPRRAPQPAPGRDRRAHLRVVPEPAVRRQEARRQPRRHTTAILVVATGLIFGSLLASAVFHGLLAGGQTHLDQLDTRRAQEREALAQDRLELANLRSPERIAAEAEAMGMVPADTQHWVSAGSGDESVVVRDDPAAADPSTTDPSTTDPTTTDPNGATAGDELAAGGGGGAQQ